VHKLAEISSADAEIQESYDLVMDLYVRIFRACGNRELDRALRRLRPRQERLLRTRYVDGIRSGHVVEYQLRLFNAIRERQLNEVLAIYDQAVAAFRDALARQP